MKCIETWRWKTPWNGKWSTTRFHSTEEDIRRTHPEAVRVEGTLIVREIPEAPEEKSPTLRSWPMPSGRE